MFGDGLDASDWLAGVNRSGKVFLAHTHPPTDAHTHNRGLRFYGIGGDNRGRLLVYFQRFNDPIGIGEISWVVLDVFFTGRSFLGATV